MMNVSEEKHIHIAILPGCIGHITMRGSGDACEDCKVTAACDRIIEIRKLQFIKTLDQIYDSQGRTLGWRYTVKPRAKAVAKPKPKAIESVAIMTNKRAASVYASLVKRNIDLTLLKQGVNPLDSKAPAWLSIIISMLLVEPRSKADLRNAITAALEVSATAANNYVFAAVNMLGAVGVINQNKDIVEIIR